MALTGRTESFGRCLSGFVALLLIIRLLSFSLCSFFKTACFSFLSRRRFWRRVPDRRIQIQITIQDPGRITRFGFLDPYPVIAFRDLSPLLVLGMGKPLYSGERWAGRVALSAAKADAKSCQSASSSLSFSSRVFRYASPCCCAKFYV